MSVETPWNAWLCPTGVGEMGAARYSCRLQANALKKKIKYAKTHSVQPEEHEITR